VARLRKTLAGTRFAPLDPAMAKKRSRARKPRAEDLQGRPPREATIIRSDAERRAEQEAAGRRETSPRLTGGDLDADWERAHLVGEEAPGGTVATPDQDVVDEIGDALGVPRAADEEVRTSSEILDERDRRRWEQEQP
jgi:hypothetical protein